MDPSGLDTATAKRFEVYLDTIGATLRDKRQRASFATYAAGLLSDGARKSMEPMAARASTDPALTSAIHHRLIHFGVAPEKSDTFSVCVKSAELPG